MWSRHQLNSVCQTSLLIFLQHGPAVGVGCATLLVHDGPQWYFQDDCLVVKDEDNFLAKLDDVSKVLHRELNA